MKKLTKNLIFLLTILFLNQSAFCYVLSGSELYQEIYQKIKNTTNFDNFKINITGIPQEKIITNEKTKPRIEIINQNKNFEPNSYKRVVVKDSNNNTIKTFPINVQTLVYKEVLVAKNPINYGGSIDSSNTIKEKKEVSRYLNKILEDLPKNISANRNYPKGSLILVDGIKQKPLVDKNSTVDIIFLSQKGLKITLQGKALKEGAFGETIQVRTNKYNKIYSAQVSSNNQVTVRI